MCREQVQGLHGIEERICEGKGASFGSGWVVGLLRPGRQRAAAFKIDHDILPADPRRDIRDVSLASIGKVEAIGWSAQCSDDGHLKASIPILLPSIVACIDPYLDMVSNH